MLGEHIDPDFTDAPMVIFGTDCNNCVHGRGDSTKLCAVKLISKPIFITDECKQWEPVENTPWTIMRNMGVSLA